MNIFILDYDKKLNAKAHTNSHIIKMPLELIQILCTNLNSFGYTVPMKPTHLNHPSSIWVRASYDNMLYTYELAEELCKEYSYRYGKKHQVETYLEEIVDMVVDSERFVKSIGLTDFARVVPEHSMKEDAVESYRQYYLVEKLPQVKRVGLILIGRNNLNKKLIKRRFEMKERFKIKKEDLGELKTTSTLASEYSVGKHSKQLMVTVDYITREVKFNVVLNKESILETLDLDEAILKFNLS